MKSPAADVLCCEEEAPKVACELAPDEEEDEEEEVEFIVAELPSILSQLLVSSSSSSSSSSSFSLFCLPERGGQRDKKGVPKLQTLTLSSNRNRRQREWGVYSNGRGYG